MVDRARVKVGQDLVDAWNEQYPPGTPVEYLPPSGREVSDRRCGRTRSKAVVRDGVPKVMVEGCDTLVDLNECVPFQLGPDDREQLDEFSQAVAAAAECRVVLELDALVAVSLIGAIQVCCRHPMLSEGVGEVLREIARGMQGQLPEPLATLTDRGWDSFYDAQAIEMPAWDGVVDTSRWAGELGN